MLPFEAGVRSSNVIGVSDSEFLHGFLLLTRMAKGEGLPSETLRRQNACVNAIFMYLNV